MTTSITYRQAGDYLLPNLSVPDTPPLGVWGLRRRDFLRRHKRGIYTALQLSGKLDAHLVEIDAQAQAMLERLIGEMARREGVTEALKAADQLEWARRMNSIRNRAEETVRADLIIA